MAHRFFLVAVVSIVCANPSWSNVARSGEKNDADRPGLPRANPARTFDASPSGPYESGQRSTSHAFDFWQESESLTFSSRTADSVCADLNGDGLPELIRLGIEYGNPYGGTLGITLGGAYGMQGPEINLHLLPSPRSVRAVDVNGDGLIDVIAAHLRPVPNTSNQFIRTATMFIQTGVGGGGNIEFLSPAPQVDLAPGGEIVLYCDVDQDQIADLVSVGNAHELYYQHGLGLAPGTPAVPQFQAQAINISRLAAKTAGLPAGSTFSFGFANDLASGDFDGDGSTDLAVAAGSSLGGGLHMYYQRPAGWVYQGIFTQSPGGPSAKFITSLARGDFNGDGLDDLVATSPQQDLSTLLNNGSSSPPAGPAASVGMSALTSPTVGRNSFRAVSADFNGDGLADVAFFDITQRKVVVACNASTNSTPGVFSDLPAFLNAYDMRGSGPRSLDALDIDGDGDVDLVGSYLTSQSTAVLANERLANARKPTSVIRVRGAPTTCALSDSFLPDGLEYEQSPNLTVKSNVAADQFTFQTNANPGERLRLRLHMRAYRPGVSVRLGLFDTIGNRVRWVHTEAVGTIGQDILVLVPEAHRFVSNAQRVELFVLSSGSSGTFRTAIDQISAEVIQ